jgi:hypothetical protein
MGALADTLGRNAGELIRAADWNALIAAIESMHVELSGRIDAVDDRVDGVQATVDALDGRVASVENRFAALEETVESLRQHFRRVTLQAQRINFAVGELAEITARVTDLNGQPLDLANAAARPWIDFVTAWGQLKPATGFESLGGAGDRTISVRVNQQGIARVLLRAEHTEGLADEVEAEVAGALQTAVAANSNRSVVETILGSATPLEAQERGAFRLLTTEYNRTDALSVRNYVDAYYVKQPSLVTGRFAPTFHHRWRDYRSTVVAFAKPDNDPRTPDPSLGASSIQITFRDWIGPWITLDYLRDIPLLVDNYRDRFRGRINNSFTDTAGRLKAEVGNIVRDKGLIAKQKDYQAIFSAMERLDLPNPPPFLQQLTQNVRSGVLLQQSVELGQNGAIGVGGQPVAFEAFADTGVLADSRATQVEKQLTDLVARQTDQTRQQVLTQVDQRQANFRTELLAENGLLRGVQQEMTSLRTRVADVNTQLGQKANRVELTRFLER